MRLQFAAVRPGVIVVGAGPAVSRGPAQRSTVPGSRRAQWQRGATGSARPHADPNGRGVSENEPHVPARQEVPPAPRCCPDATRARAKLGYVCGAKRAPNAPASASTFSTTSAL